MKKEEKTELTKERILTAAMTEFGKKGYFGASLNHICGSGISKGLFYHNFKNKDAIYLACIEKSIHSLLEYLQQQDLGLNLHKYMDARLDFFHKNDYATRLFFEAALQPPVQLKEEINKLQKDFNEFNRQLYKRILSSLSLREGIEESDAMEYFSLMQHMFNGYFSSPHYNNMPLSELVAAHEINLTKFLDFMLYGIVERSVDK